MYLRAISAALSLSLTLTLWGGQAAAQNNSELEPTLVEELQLRSVGITDRRIAPTNATLLDPESGAEATLLQGHHNRGDGIVVRFQPSTGESEYLVTHGGAGSWSIVSVGDGEAYLGSHLEGFLYHLEPGASEFNRIDLPRPDDWIWSIDRASDGLIYLGTYPGGELLRYDPGDGSVVDLGPVLPDDGRERYVRSLNAEFAGKLFLGMGAEPELIEWDLATGQKRFLLPERFKDRSFVYNVDRVGDLVAASVSPRVVILLIDPDTRQVVHEIEAPNDASMWLGNQQSVILHDDEIYFGTRGDDALWAYSLETRSTRLARAGVGGPIGLARDRFLFTHNYFGTYFVIDLVSDEIVVERPSKFEGAGMDIHTLGRGPAGTVAGGTYINQGFFLYDPASDSLYTPGPAVSFGGQIDNVVTHDGLLYLAHYTSARLTVYDPRLHWNPGSSPDANPRLVATVGHDQDRFPTAVVGTDDRIYLGTIPKYGKLGGALVVYDPATSQTAVHRNVVENQSVHALTEAGAFIYGSTSVLGGLGSKPTRESGTIFRWDKTAQEKTFEHVPVKGARELWGLDRLPDGVLVGSADSLLYVFDPVAQRVLVDTVATPEVITRLVASSDGWVYAVTEERFIRASPDLGTIQTIGVDPDYWDSLVETDDGRLFVSRGSELLEVVRQQPRGR
jgi:outer membrane protein assembly factor BamB